MKTKVKNIFKGGLGQMTIPIIAICLLVIFNLFRDPTFFSITVTHNNDGNIVLKRFLRAGSALYHRRMSCSFFSFSSMIPSRYTASFMPCEFFQ